MGGSNLMTYVVVFLVVFIPYAFLQACLDTRWQRSEDKDSRNLPGLFYTLYGLLGRLSQSFGRWLGDLQPNRRETYRKRLLLAAIRMEPDYVFSAEWLCGFAGAVLPFLAMLTLSHRWDVGLAAGLLFGLAGWCYPGMTVTRLAQRRQETIMKNLPFSIDLIGAAMRAGLDFSAAVRYYVGTERKTNPLAVEFGIMLRQMELGKTRVEALEDMAKRVQTDEFNSFVGAVAHGTEIGASIVETMRIQGEEMRRARFNRAERKAARAPSIMILPLVVFIMPAIFVIIGTPVLIRIQQSALGAMIQ